jgi:hypothetical protein
MERGLQGGNLPQAVTFRDRLASHADRAYRLGQEYESKGCLGKFIMQLSHMGSKRHELEGGRVTYNNYHYREQVIAAHNQEVIDSWPD